MQTLSLTAYPGQYGSGFNLFGPTIFNLSSLVDLTSPYILSRIVGAFAEYYDNVLLPQITANPPSVIGINITYTSQLPFALWLLQRLRASGCGSYLLCGGTEVSDIWKYSNSPRLFRNIFANADACVVGEGESAFVEILCARSKGREPQGIRNTIRIRNEEDSQLGNIHYVCLDDLPIPDYKLLDNSQYFFPDVMVYYSPTRGCYWNKCTFCDYGLNFGTPTSPWRQRSTDRIIADLSAIAQQSRFVYLSVDVLAPSALLRVAHLMLEHKIALKWAAEIRLERYFTPERCRLLAESGCVALSVGFESGNQRVLDAINKGTKLEEIRTTIRAFSEAGIAAQMMGFTGFPTETSEEALESVQYLNETKPWWTVSGLGNFTLTPGSMIAQRPREFGISSIGAAPGDDVRRVLTFDSLRQDSGTSEDVEAAKAVLNTAEFDRPFAGGIDSTHSVFYYAAYGTEFPERVLREAEDQRRLNLLPGSCKLNGSFLRCRRDDLLTLFDNKHLRAELQDFRRKGNSLHAAAILSRLSTQKREAAESEQDEMYFIRSDGVILPCPYLLSNTLEILTARQEAADGSVLPLQNGDAAALLHLVTLWDLVVRQEASYEGESGTQALWQTLLSETSI